MIILRHTVVLPGSHFRRIALPFTLEFYVRNLLKEKIRHTRFWEIGILQHDSEADPLLVAARKIECNLPPVRKVQTARLFLYIAPVRSDVDLLREWELDQIFQRSFQRLPGTWSSPVSSEAYTIKPIP